MLILLTGGSGHGKSTLARKLLENFPCPRYLVDTALVYDEAEAIQRNKRQDALRLQNIETIHQGRDLDRLLVPEGSSAVLECMCHLTANEMFSCHTMFDPKQDFRPVFSRILRGIWHLHHRCENLIIVTNEVSCDGIRYDESTAAYQQMLGKLNAEIAGFSDCVCEVVCGIPVVLKGTLPNIHPEEESSMSNQILVIGPENAGKTEYVRSLGYTDADMSEKLYDDCPVLLNLQKIVLNGIGSLPDVMEQLNRKRVIVCCEVGSGIIPVSKELTDARVLTGTICNALAKNASGVTRVVCGIPTTLK